MNQIERVADGKRRFFPAPGTVDTVFLRDRKGHADRALEPGRDYEIERGGIALSRVPFAGERVIILIGDRETQEVASVVVSTERVIEREVPIVRERVVEVPVERLVPVGTKPDSGALADLEPLKRHLIGAAWKTNDSIPNRTAEWQDALARRAAGIWTATTIDDVRAAYARVEAFLKGAA